MELIDVDAHLGQLPDAPVTWPDAAGLVEVQRRLGVTACLLTTVSARLHDPLTGNAETVEALDAVPGARACPMIVPALPGEPRTTDTPAWQVAVAATAMPRLHGWSLTGPGCEDVFESMSERALPLRLSALEVSLAAVEAFSTAHPQIPVLLTEVGYRALRELAGLLTRTPSVHLVLTNFATHLGLEWLVEQVGSARILYGTGTPWHDPGSATARLLWSALDDDDVAAIAHGNAVRLMPALASDRVGVGR
ncbi:amidohydrolase family protein [Propionibacteriaceae bacterium Y1685]|uniref:amidohydrolase family protein n=1 Tax=Microlunatus sp. Y1700 TaxID=3418487 RepID=UPI003B78CE5F